MSIDPSAPRRSSPVATASSRPLVVSDRGELLDDVVRLAAAAGVEVDVVPDLVAARSAWFTAPLVVVDDAALRVDPERAPARRRSDVVLIGSQVDDPQLWRRAVVVGAEHVVFLPDADGWLVEQFADVRDGGARTGHVVGVVGGRGGAGATTLAAALAVTGVRRGANVLLVDLDPLGGGIDLALGVEGASGLRWPDLANARGRLNGAALKDALPRSGELPVLAWDRGTDVEVPFEAARAVVDAAVRCCDLVVVDLPRAGGEAAAHVAARATHTLMVVPAEVRAVASAERVLRHYRAWAGSMRAVVRESPARGLTAHAVCEALALPLAGVLRPEPKLAQSLERGEPPAHRGRGPLAAYCAEFLDDLDHE